ERRAVANNIRRDGLSAQAPHQDLVSHKSFSNTSALAVPSVTEEVPVQYGFRGAGGDPAA
ncbi:MAG: hypothetical protein ACJ8EL_03510, partial [Rhizomicrobium sp.]